MRALAIAAIIASLAVPAFAALAVPAFAQDPNKEAQSKAEEQKTDQRKKQDRVMSKQGKKNNTGRQKHDGAPDPRAAEV